MKLRNLAISIFLLFTYSLGFAHVLVPHCQDVNFSGLTSLDVKDDDHYHNHHYHHSIESDNESHQHVVHENHFDENIYDFILCVFNEVEHQENDCCTQYIIAQKTSIEGINKGDVTKLLSVFFTVVKPVLHNVNYCGFDSEIASIYLSPPLHNSSSRGPPNIS